MSMAQALLGGDPSELIKRYIPQAEKGIIDILQAQTLEEGEARAGIVISENEGKVFITFVGFDENNVISSVKGTSELAEFIVLFLNPKEQ